MRSKLFLASLAMAAIVYPVVSIHAHSSRAHVHGEATLTVAIDGQTVTLDFDSPLDNLVGFEHAPRTDKQKQAMADMAARLGEAGKLFVLDAAAGCEAAGIKLTPAAMPAVSSGAGSASAPAASAKGEGDKAAHKAAHKDQEAQFTFRCKDAAKLRTIEVKLFEAFPRVKRIKASVAGVTGATAGKQSAMTLTPAKATLRW